MMTGRIKTFAKFVQTWSGLWLFLRIGYWIAAISLLLRLIPLPRLLRLLTPKKCPGRKWPRETLINFTSFWLGRERAFFSRSCLRRSLVLYRYLNLQGEPAGFLIGVTQEDHQLKAHSWILIGGKKLFPDENISYRVIYQYPHAGSGSGEAPDPGISGIMD